MPTYEYQCESERCGHRFEAFQRITAESLSECPKCGGSVRRLISPGAGFIFKGSGFYTTDYRSEAYKKAEKAEKDTSASKSEKKEEKPKAETKASP